MESEIKIFKAKGNGNLILTVANYKMTYIGYSATEAKSKFWAYVKREEKKNIRQSLKNIY